MPIDLPKDWDTWSNDEKRSWADSKGIKYKFQTGGNVGEGGNPREIKVTVDNAAIEDLLDDKLRLKAELADSNAKLSLVAERLFQFKKRDLGAPQSISNPKELMEWQENQKNNNDDPISHNRKTGQGAGQIGLQGNLNGGNNSKSWEDNESMIFELVQTKNIGTPEERKNAQAILNALWEKQKDAMKSGDLPNKIYEDDLKDGKSLFRRIMDAKDDEIRARLQKEREK